MNLIPCAALVGLLGLAAPPALAVQATYHPPTDVVGDTAALDKQFEALIEEYQTALYAWYDRLDEVQAANEAGAKQEYPESPDGAFYPRFWALSEKGQLDARLWCLSNFEFSALPKERQKVAKLRLYLDLIDNAHATHAEGILRALSGEADEWGDSLGRDLAFALLDELAIVSGNPDVGARVLYAKASNLEWSGQEHADLLAVEQYELLMERYPEHELTRRAEGKIFAAENLQIGLEVPDIVGTDVDGKELKLSDHSGKVAVISFWGFW